MEAPWHPTVFKLLADVAQHCPIIKDLVMDVLVSSVLKGLPYLHLTLWLLRDVYCTDRVLFLSQVGSDGCNLSICDEGLPAMLEGMDRLVCLRGYSAFFWFIYLGLAWLGI